MTELEDQSIQQLRDDIEHGLAIVQAKSAIVDVLAELPDDAARRRVMIAVAVLNGWEVVGLTPPGVKR